MARVHGHPVWFELATGTGNLDRAGDFYRKVLGWQIGDSGMEGFTYHLATADGDMVAGLMEMPGDVAGMPPAWTVYFGVEDADKAAADIRASGGRVFREPADIPGTGRFAIAADPQGAPFGILRPDPMEGGGETRAFDQQKAAHGNWLELMSTDPSEGFDFYARLFGWRKSDAIDMGEMGSYQIFAHDGADIGGMMGLGNAPQPCWLPYFGANGVNPAIGRIRDAGGTIHHGPQEVPGGAHIAVATDPQGAWFAVVGPLEETP
jgi:uncharacterized protein